MKKLNKKEKGITLIALVVTIVVLLILAGVSIAMLAGEDGIINQAQKARTETAHKGVYEALVLKANEYATEKLTGNYGKTLIDYLTEKGYISEATEGYKVNVETLMGEKQAYGNGTETDIYKLEEVTGETSTAVKLATTEPVKIAEATSSGRKEYKVTYYGKTTSEKVELGSLVDTGTTTSNNNEEIESINSSYLLTQSYELYLIPDTEEMSEMLGKYLDDDAYKKACVEYWNEHGRR